MNSVERFKATTVPCNCTRCGRPMELPNDMAFPGKLVECPHCGNKGLLVNKTYPKLCDVCGRQFNPSKTTSSIGGIAQCPHCGTIYRQATRSIYLNMAQNRCGHLKPLPNRGRYKR